MSESEGPHPLLVHADTWQDFAAQAERLPPQDRLRHLCTLLLCANPVVVIARNERIGLPVGRPAVEFARTVAGGLLSEDLEPAQRVLALLVRWSKSASTDPELADRTRGREEAEGLSRAHGDPLFLAWMLTTEARHRTLRHHADLALPVAKEAVDLASGAAPGPGPFAFVVSGWRETTDPAVSRLHLEVDARRRLAVIQRYVGDFPGWREALADAEAAARRLLPAYPRIYGEVLSSIAQQEAVVHGTADLSRFEELVPTDDVPTSRRGLRVVYLSQQAGNAERLGDLRRCIAIHRHRIRFWLEGRGIDPQLPVPEVTAIIREMPESQRRRFSDVANPAHEIGRLLQLTGDGKDRAQRHRESEEHLALANAIWEGWGSNGRVAVEFRRATLRPPSDQDATAVMLDVTRRAGRPGLRANAALEAALRADRTTAATVLEVIDGMLQEPWQQRDRAKIHTARAWLQRAGGPMPSLASAEDAEQAIALLPGAPRGALGLLARSGSAIALQGREAKDAPLERRGLDVAVDAVARLYAGATTRDYRAAVADTWSGVVQHALAFAEVHSDHRLADIVAEIARRDGAAVLANDAAEDELVPEADRLAASEAGRTAAADPEQLGGSADDAPGEGPEPASDGSSDDVMRAVAVRISDEERRVALETADRRLGALGAELDPDTLRRSEPRRLLGASDRPTFVLQLLPTTHRAVQGRPARLYRRLTWRVDDRIEERLDAVDLDPRLLDDRSSGVLRLPPSEPLFPDAFVEAFRGATRAEPLRLLVVPTDLFHLPWDALEIDGRSLIDRVIVSVHTSLTAALRIRDAVPATPQPGSVAIFDTEALPHTKRERDALERWFPVLREAQDRAGFESEAEDPGAIMALGLHGHDDSEGWAQVKVLPNADVLTAAEALQLRFPSTVVLASCHSSVRTSGTDMAGFPTAMFMRGAKTIIGSIGGIPDRSTSEILALFYERLRAIRNPVEALWDARLSWLDADPARVQQPEQWARLVVYGGAEH